MTKCCAIGDLDSFRLRPPMRDGDAAGKPGHRCYAGAWLPDFAVSSKVTNCSER
jgi:hypothetical protein